MKLAEVAGLILPKAPVLLNVRIWLDLRQRQSCFILYVKLRGYSKYAAHSRMGTVSVLVHAVQLRKCFVICIIISTSIAFPRKSSRVRVHAAVTL